MTNEKKQAIGKFIVVILGVAIVCFLLLPFLDTSSPSNTQQTKKATPQIFTSNPLSELVKKVYSLFARNAKKQANAQQQPLAAVPITNTAMPAQTPTRADTNAPVNIDATYNYEGAEFVDDSGDWILVQQTMPDSSQRGMHEINTSDSAYDKYVRQERAAKWTGRPAAPAQPQIPDSKWARMWQPIKKFFGLDQEDTRLASAGQPRQATAQLGRSEALTNNQNKQARDFAKAGLSMGDIDESNFDSSAVNPVLDILLYHPEKSIDNTVKNLKDTARNILDPKEYKEFESFIDKRGEQAKVELNQAFLQQLQGQAENDLMVDPTLAANTLMAVEQLPDGAAELASSSCGDNQPAVSSAFHGSNSCSINGPAVFPPYDHQANKQAAEEAGKLAKQQLQQTLAAISGRPSNPNVRMAFISAVVTNGQNPFQQIQESAEPGQQKSLGQKVYEMYQNFSWESEGCSSGTCFLTASPYSTAYELQDTAQSAGVNLYEIPARKTDMNKFMEYVLDSDQLTDEEKDRVLEPTFDMSKYTTSWRFVSADTKIPDNVMIHALTPSVGLEVANQGYSAARIIAGAPGYADLTQGSAPVDEGRKITTNTANHITQAREIVNASNKKLSQEGSEQLVKKGAEATVKNMSTDLKNLDAAMGL